MDQATAQLIIIGLTLAENVAFTIGGKIVEINTANLTDPKAIQTALQAAAAEGFPQLQFRSTAA